MKTRPFLLGSLVVAILAVGLLVTSINAAVPLSSPTSDAGVHDSGGLFRDSFKDLASDTRVDLSQSDPCAATKARAVSADVISKQCTALMDHLPQDFEMALLLDDFVLVVESIDTRPLRELLDDVRCIVSRAEQSSDELIEREARAYVLKIDEYLNKTSGKNPIRYSGTMPRNARTPSALRKAWEDTYYSTYLQGAVTGRLVEDRLRYRLGLLCTTRDPNWAVLLVDSYIETMRFKESLELIDWLEKNKTSIDLDHKASLERKIALKADLQKQSDTCPLPPIFTKIPAAELAASASAIETAGVNSRNYRELVNTYLRLYCETGLKRQLLNAASVVKSLSIKPAELQEAQVWADSLGQTIDPKYERHGLTEALKVHKRLTDWDRGFWFSRHTELGEYATVVGGADSDPSLAYAQYFIALVLNSGNGAPDEAERLRRALAARTSRYLTLPCQRLEMAGPLPLAVPDPEKRLACTAPPPRTPPCGPRQEAVKGICYYTDYLRLNTCPSDMEQVGDWCTCPAGKLVTDDGYCCWPGQSWNKHRNECYGTPKCDMAKGFVPLGNTSCWDESSVSTVRADCYGGKSGAINPCTALARHHYCSRVPLTNSDDPIVKGRAARVRAEEDREILALYDRGCEFGERSACWDGAIFATSATGTPPDASRSEFLERLYNAHAPGAVFPYSEVVITNEVQREQILERICWDEDQYTFEGAAASCGWLADRYLKTKTRYDKGVKLHQYICQHGHWIVSRINETCIGGNNGLDKAVYSSRQQSSREKVRRSCEIVAGHYASQKLTLEWQNAVLDALFILPDDTHWAPEETDEKKAGKTGVVNRSNEYLRDWLSAQSQDSTAWCGRRTARPRDPKKPLPPNWNTYRCFPLPKNKPISASEQAVKNKCLFVEDYSEPDHGCPGLHGTPQEKACCPIEPLPSVPDRPDTKTSDAGVSASGSVKTIP